MGRHKSWCILDAQNNALHNKRTFPVIYQLRMKRIFFIAATVREHAVHSYLNYRVKILARVSQSDRKLFDKENRKLEKILTAE